MSSIDYKSNHTGGQIFLQAHEVHMVTGAVTFGILWFPNFFELLLVRKVT